MKIKISLITNLLFILTVIVSVGNVNAQVWTNYTTSDGLIDGWIYDIEKDNEGNFWFSSWNSVATAGLVKFDGTNWTEYSTADGLSSNIINDIIFDDNGNLWCATEDAGISVFDGTNWDYITQSSGLIGDAVRSLFLDSDNNIWVGNSDLDTESFGVSKFDGTNWTTHLYRFSKAFAQSSNGDIWVGGYYGVHHFDGTNWLFYNTKNGLSSNNVYAMAFDADNNLWVGNFENTGLDKFDGTNWTTYTTADGLADNNVRAMLLDSDNNMWFGTNAGLSKFDGTNWETLDESDGLISNLVRSIHQESNGHFWFGTMLGVSKYEPVLGIGDNTEKKSVLVFPNPTSGLLNVSYETTIIQIEIYNLLGQLVKSNTNSSTIDISGISQGVYFIKVKDENGNVGTKKVVKI